MNKYLKDIQELDGIPVVETLSDILKIQDFVFSLIPYTEKPHLTKIGLEKVGAVKDDLVDIYKGCKAGEVGGWCGLNAEYFRLILVSYGIRCWPYNFGLVNTRFTHVCLIAELNGIQFLLDPYFNRVYTYKDDFILQFPDLLRLVQERKLDCIGSSYGAGMKKVETAEGFIPNDGREFEKSVLGYFYSIGLRKTLLDLFSEDDFRILLLIKIPDPPKVSAEKDFAKPPIEKEPGP